MKTLPYTPLTGRQIVEMRQIIPRLAVWLRCRRAAICIGFDPNQIKRHDRYAELEGIPKLELELRAMESASPANN